MNVTAKDIDLISETANSLRYPLPFAFRQRIENRTESEMALKKIKYET